jgi:hypothetical protein
VRTQLSQSKSLRLIIISFLGLMLLPTTAQATPSEAHTWGLHQGKPKKNRKKDRKKSSRKKDRKKSSRKKTRPEQKSKPSCKARNITISPGPAGPLLQAVGYLPSPHRFPKGTDQVVLSALVQLGRKTAVLFDPIELRKKGKGWILDRIQAEDQRGAARIKQLHRVGVRPHPCPDSPDKFLSGIHRQIRKGTWEKVLLHSTWRWNPGAHSLVDDIAADMKLCGKKRYMRNLKKLPRFGEIKPETWFVLLKYQITGDSHGTQVELGLVPVDGSWRIAHLRMICN